MSKVNESDIALRIAGSRVSSPRGKGSVSFWHHTLIFRRSVGEVLLKDLVVIADKFSVEVFNDSKEAMGMEGWRILLGNMTVTGNGLSLTLSLTAKYEGPDSKWETSSLADDFKRMGYKIREL